MREVSREVFKEEVLAWARRIGVTDRIEEICLRYMKRKWASCSSRGRLTFDIALLSQPASFRAEVIVHELIHLKLGNGSHGRLFRALVKAYLQNSTGMKSQEPEGLAGNRYDGELKSSGKGVG